MIGLLLLAGSAGYSASLPNDAALDKHVTLAVKGEALSDVMPTLEKQTGARVRAAKEIADQKVTIYVDDKPLREVMQGLSSLFGYFWSVKSYSTGTIYEIWQDEKSAKALTSQREKAIDAALRAAWEKMRFKAELAAKTPEEREALRVELSQGASKDSPQTKARVDAIAQVQKEPLQGICAGMLADLPQNYSSLLRLGVSVRFDTRSTEPEWTISTTTRKTIAEQLDNMTSQMSVTVSGMNLPTGDVDPDSVNLNVAIKIQGSLLQILGTVAGMTKPPSDGSARTMMFPRVRPVILAQEAIGSHVDPAKLPGGGDTSAWKDKAGITADDLTKASEAYPADARTGLLNRSDILDILHRKLGLQVMSDHYSHWTRWLITEDMSVLDILKLLYPIEGAMALTTQKADWGYDGKLLYVRVRDILSADSSESPNRLVRHWADVYRDKGGLGLEEQADIAALGADQGMNLRMFGPYLGIGNQIAFGTPALRLYGMLSQAQRQQAWAAGTSVDAFTPDQRTALAQVFFRTGNSFSFTSGVPPTGAIEFATGPVQVGIWTTESPSNRLDKPGSAMDNAPNPEPPVTVAVKEGSPQPGAGVRVGLPGGGNFTSSTTVTRIGPGQSGSPTVTTVENTVYTMTFTFADGRTQQMGINVPKLPSPDKPATGAGN